MVNPLPILNTVPTETWVESHTEDDGAISRWLIESVTLNRDPE
ncbi:MAG: hypothetical protein AAGC54_20230 [Cyanobacteria bacterium P01_F01_bin.4]